MEEEVEVHDGGRGVFVYLKFGYVHGSHAEYVAVRPVPCWRCSTHESGSSGVVAMRYRPGGKRRAALTADDSARVGLKRGN